VYAVVCSAIVNVYRLCMDENHCMNAKIGRNIIAKGVSGYVIV